MKILIAGAGISGLAMARSLEDLEYEITIIEKQADFSMTGFSFLIWPNGQKIMRDLGLQKTIKQFHVVQNYTVYDEKKAILRHFDFSTLSQMPIKIKRKILHDDLLGKVRIPIQFGTYIRSIVDGPNEVSVTFNNGEIREFDLVIGADGRESELRNLIGGTTAKSSGWEGNMFWGPVIPDFPNQGIHQIWGPEIFFGSFPHGGDQVVYYIGYPETSTNKSDALRTTLTNCIQELSLPLEILDQVQSEGDVYRGQTKKVPLGKIHSQRCVLIGDAAHGMPWAMGMGVTMAMEDVALLAQLLCSNEKGLSEILNTFSRTRRTQLKTAYKLTDTMWRAIRCPKKFINIRNRWIRNYDEGKFVSRLEKLF